MSSTQILAPRRKRGKPVPPPAATRPPTRITPQEACDLLGISKNTLYRMAKAGRIPAMPIGVVGWGFFREPLEAWKAQQLSHGLEAQP